MAKFETNLSEKDKITIAILLFGAAVFMFAWFMIRPTITQINEISDDIDQETVIQTTYRNKLINLASAESAFDTVTAELADSTSDFYESMRSSGIDRMMTNYVMSFGLYPEDLTITMPDGPVAEIPYQYSEAMINQTERAYVPTPTPTPVVTRAADSSDSGSESQSLSASAAATMVDSLFVPYQDARIKATSTETSGVECASITIVVNGSAAACQAMIDDLCTKPSLRITGFAWSAVDSIEVFDEETGTVEIVDSGLMRLRVNINLYMADIADYQALVAEAAETAEAEA